MAAFFPRKDAKTDVGPNANGDDIVDLFREFTCRCENNDLGLRGRRVHTLKRRDGKRAGLACAGLSLRDDIAFLNNGKY